MDADNRPWKAGADKRRLNYRVVESSEQPPETAGVSMERFSDKEVADMFRTLKEQWDVDTVEESSSGTTFTCTCGKMGLSILYSIKNRENGSSLGVGSECVNHFQEGRMQEQKKTLNRALRMRQQLAQGNLSTSTLHLLLKNGWICRSQRKKYAVEPKYRNDVHAIMQNLIEGDTFLTARPPSAESWHCLHRFPGGANSKGFGARKHQGRYYWQGDLRFAPDEVLAVVDMAMPVLKYLSLWVETGAGGCCA